MDVSCRVALFFGAGGGRVVAVAVAVDIELDEDLDRRVEARALGCRRIWPGK